MLWLKKKKGKLSVFYQKNRVSMGLEIISHLKTPVAQLMCTGRVCAGMNSVAENTANRGEQRQLKTFRTSLSLYIPCTEKVSALKVIIIKQFNCCVPSGNNIFHSQQKNKRNAFNSKIASDDHVIFFFFPTCLCQKWLPTSDRAADDCFISGSSVLLHQYSWLTGVEM